MRKLFLTGTNYLTRPFRMIGKEPARLLASGVWCALILSSNFGQAQDTAAADTAAAASPAEVAYPLNLAVGPAGEITIVDLDLPGLWRLAAPDESPTLFFRGTKLLRQPMNRPRCVVALTDGSVLVGDSASRDIYRIAADTTELKGLTDGFIGIPMSLIVDPSGETVYVGDAEKRALFRFPLAGGKPELVARVNARGLSFGPEGLLWAITPDDAAVVTIDDQGKVEPRVTGRPFQYPGGIVHVGQTAYVTDGYGKAIWKIAPGEAPQKWFEGQPLKHPVGIAKTDDALLVADPHNKQVFRFKRTDAPTAEPLLPE